MSPSDRTTPGSKGFLLSRNVIDLNDYQVVGGYVWFDPKNRETLKDFCGRVSSYLEQPRPGLKSFLVWGPSGSGKSGLVEELGAVLREKKVVPSPMLIDLSRVESREDFHAALEEFHGFSEPKLCWVEEVDAKSDQEWPYDELFPRLPLETDVNRTVFVFTGSGRANDSLDSFTKGIEGRHKGKDVLTRTSLDRTVVPVADPLDRVMIACSVVARALAEKSPSNREGFHIEKLALLYFASAPEQGSTRVLSECVFKTIDRILREGQSALGIRVRYNHIFESGSPARDAFLNSSQIAPNDLEKLREVIRVIPAFGMPVSPRQKWLDPIESGLRSQPKPTQESMTRGRPVQTILKASVSSRDKSSTASGTKEVRLRQISGWDDHFSMYKKMKSEAARMYYALWTNDWDPRKDYWENESSALVARAQKPEFDDFKARRIISKDIVQRIPHSVDLHIRIMQQAMDWGIYDVRVLEGLKSFEMMLTDHMPKGSGKREYRVMWSSIQQEPESLLIETGPDTAGPIASVGPALAEVFEHLWSVAKVHDSLRGGDGDVWKTPGAVKGYFQEVDLRPQGLLDDYERMEWESLLKLLDELSREDARGINVCEVGSGTGRLLRRLAKHDSVKKVVGIDYSKPMIDSSKDYLKNPSADGSDALTPQMIDKIQHIQADIRNAEAVPRLELEEGKRLICCVLNTLGVFRTGADRIDVLRAMCRIGGRDSELFVSVWNGARFSEHYKRVYDSLPTLVGTEERAWSVDKNSRNFTTNRGYFSHWFLEEEIKRLVRLAGCPAPKVEPLGNVGFAVRGKTAS